PPAPQVSNRATADDNWRSKLVRLLECGRRQKAQHTTHNVVGRPPVLDREKSWPHLRSSAGDFCGSRLAIGAATERARALAMPAGTRAQVYKRDSSGVAPASPQVA